MGIEEMGFGREDSGGAREDAREEGIGPGVLGCGLGLEGRWAWGPVERRGQLGLKAKGQAWQA